MADKRIPELPSILIVNGSYLFAAYDPSTDTTYRISLSQFLPTQDPNTYLWDEEAEYDTGAIAISDDKLWQSLIDDNIGIAPVEGASWTEVSKSLASAIQKWTAGVYTEPDPVVLSNHNGAWKLYLLVDAVRPYASANIATEETAGDWEEIGGLSLSNVVLDTGVITLPFKGASFRQFRTVAVHSANFSIALSGDTNARRFDYSFELDASREITLQASFKMSDALWNTATQKWIPEVGGKYLMQGVFDGADWLAWIRGPFE
jgi:hypothetical protein